eukprot:3421217-Alexandrium_andersonii.AAC.1
MPSGALPAGAGEWVRDRRGPSSKVRGRILHCAACLSQWWVVGLGCPQCSRRVVVTPPPSRGRGRGGRTSPPPARARARWRRMARARQYLRT